MDWSTFFSEFRNGGLGIYGGVIMGYLAALACAKVKKQDFRIVADAIMPGLFLAQPAWAESIQTAYILKP